MTRVFISYSRRDQAFAIKLSESLAGVGIDVWIDMEDIPAGMKWSTAIQHGLQTSEIMIVVISPESMASNNVEDEWQYFLDKGKPIVPVLLHPSDIHFQLSRIQYINFDKLPYELGLRHLYAELRQKGASIDIPPDYEMTDETMMFVKENNAPLKAKSTRPAWLLPLLLLVIAIGIGIGAVIVLSQGNSGAVAEPTATVTPTPTIATATPTESSTEEPTEAPTATDEPATAAPTATDEQVVIEDAPRVIASQSAVNVRGSDGPGGQLLGTLPFNAEADILGTNEFETWWYIEYTDADGAVMRGWVSEPLVSEAGNLDDLPQIDPNTGQPISNE